MTKTQTHTPQLTRRERGKLQLLEAIAAHPGRTKMAVITNNGAWQVPNKTRSGQYRIIDSLLQRGLVADAKTDPNGYALVPTAAGLAEIAYWASR